MQRHDAAAACAVIRLPLTRDESGSLIQQPLKIENFRRMRELILNRRGEPVFCGRTSER
jgi:hypothetical protein